MADRRHILLIKLRIDTAGFSDVFLQGPDEAGNRYHTRQRKQEYGDS
jgi:hypothetical protein